MHQRPYPNFLLLLLACNHLIPLYPPLEPKRLFSTDVSLFQKRTSFLHLLLVTLEHRVLLLELGNFFRLGRHLQRLAWRGCGARGAGRGVRITGCVFVLGKWVMARAVWRRTHR